MNSYARLVRSQNGTFWTRPSQVDACKKSLPASDGRVETPHDGVTDGHGGGMNFDHHLIVPSRRFLHFLQP